MQTGSHKKKAKPKKATPVPQNKMGRFYYELRKRKILETLAAFLGGGWLILEIVHWILIDHYHFPEKSLDITIISLFCALICAIIWRWFRGGKGKKRIIKVEFLLMVPFIILSLFLNIKLLLKPEESGHYTAHATENISEVREQNSLGIMYFENNTGSANLDHWKKALCELLITDLSQSRYIHVISGDRLYHILDKLKLMDLQSYSSEVLRKVASMGNVAHILRGSFARAGNLFRINVTIQEAISGKLIGSESVEGEGEESIFSLVDNLSRRIKPLFQLSKEVIAADLDKEAGKITTSSLKALQLYSEGRKYHNWGDFRKSIESMKKAISYDPEFAMAFRSMAAAYGNLGYESERGNYLQKAMALSERLSDREFLLIQGDVYGRLENTYDKAIKAFEELLEFYPEDDIGNVNLGVLYNKLEQWDKAIERFEALLRHKDSSILAHLSLSASYGLIGQYDKSENIIKSSLQEYPDNTSLHRTLALIHLVQGNYDLAMDSVNKALTLEADNQENYIIKGDLFLTQGNFSQAEEEFQKLQELQEPIAEVYSLALQPLVYISQGRMQKAGEILTECMELIEKKGMVSLKYGLHNYFGKIYFLEGKLEEALLEFDKSFQYYKERNDTASLIGSVFAKGLIYHSMRDLDKAMGAAGELKNSIDGFLNPKLMRYYYHLYGLIETERGNFHDAENHLKQAILLLPAEFSPADDHAIFHDGLARTYYLAGDLEKAQKEFEKILSLTTSRIYFGDVYAKSLYMLGRICQDRNWPGKAIAYYEQFLSLWQDADPVFSEVNEAKKRLNELKSR